ncbi:MAG: M23 family metallopeptidase, partial [Treponema sp.]|nr:M23 family metallopeptidase [Treponema sp.]
DPFTGIKQHHTGIDMACPTGTPIKAAKSGKVSFTGYSNVYGKYVIVTHADGYQTLYGHMSRITTKKGQVVDQGSQLGLVGSTGYSTGPHLHLSVYKNGKLIDPLSVLK